MKENAIKQLAMTLAAGLVLAGCASTSISRLVNRSNLDKLQVGMAQADVRDLMGKPYKTKSYPIGQVWYYDTGLRRDEHGVHHETLTPLFFEDGKLVKWEKPEILELHLE